MVMNKSGKAGFRWSRLKAVALAGIAAATLAFASGDADAQAKSTLRIKASGDIAQIDRSSVRPIRRAIWPTSSGTRCSLSTRTSSRNPRWSKTYTLSADKLTMTSRCATG